MLFTVFDHRKELDFLTMLNANNAIALPDSTILYILHAHTRANVIRNFCLPSMFTLFDELEKYMSLYWNKCVNMDNTIIGHSMRKLDQIYYLNDHRLPCNAPPENK